MTAGDVVVVVVLRWMRVACQLDKVEEVKSGQVVSVGILTGLEPR